jgi:hypothetical protein
MASKMIVNMTVAELEETIQRAVSLALSEKDSLPLKSNTKSNTKTKSRKVKDPSAPKKEPNEFALFNKRINALLKENSVQSKASENMQFASYLKNQKSMAEWTDEDILLEREGWSKPEISKQESEGKNKRKNSVASVEVTETVSAPVAVEEKPKRIISDEHKAKMKAGREAAKAKKDAEKAALTAAVPAPAPAPAPAPVAAPVPVKPASAKPTVKKASAPVNPPPTPVAATETETETWVKKAFGGKKYLFNPANNQVRLMEADGSMGEWVGICTDLKKGIIDRSAPEPEEEGEDFEVDEE